MAGMIPDDLDFSAYMRDTACKAKVRKASVFADELAQQFDDAVNASHPCVESTKLRRLIQFRPGEITVWAGYNGHRKSMFLGQAMVDLCFADQRVLCASFEMQPAATLARMAKQAFASPKPSQRQLDALMRWTDGKLWVFDHFGRVDPSMCMAVVRYFAEELRGTQVVIDSMMMVCASEESLDDQKQFTTDLVRVAQETGMHIHLVAHCRKPQTGDERMPSKYDLRGSAAISDQAHNVLLVWANKAKADKLAEGHPMDSMRDEPDAVVHVAKQRNGPGEGKVKLWFDERTMRFCDSPTDAVQPYPVPMLRDVSRPYTETETETA